MTDKHKQLKLSDLDLPRRPGRPKTGTALSPAEKQRLYRLRKKGRSIVLTQAEASTVLSALYHFSEHGNSKHTYEDLARLMARFGNFVHGYPDLPATDTPSTVQPAPPATDP